MGAVTDTAQEQKRQALAAGAEAGKAGVQAFEAAQQTIAAQQQAAVQRAHEISGVVGVTESAQRGLDAITRTPYDMGAASLAQTRARYDANRAAADASNAAYFDKISAIEPMIDALREANAAGGGGGSGGGGGGGDGPTGGIGDLTDAQLGKFLMNKAVEQRTAALAKVQAERDRLSQERQIVQQRRERNRKVLRKKGRLGKLALRKPQKLERRIERVGNRLERVEDRMGSMALRRGTTEDRIANRDRQRELQARLNRLTRVGERSRRQVELRGQAKFLQGQLGAAEQEFLDLVPTEGNRPLSEDALAIADSLGVDPTLAESLVGPTLDAQYGRALAYQAGQQQPGLYADAATLKVRPAELARLTSKPAWDKMSRAVQSAAAEGASREWFEQSLLASLADKETAKKQGLSRAEVETLVRLALKRYSFLFPTITEQQRLADAEDLTATVP